MGAMFTTLYSVKVLYLTFLTNPNGPLVNYKQAHEGDIFMNLPLIILAIFSIFFGYITKDIFIGLGSSFFSDNSLFIHPSHEIMLDTEFAVPTLFKLLPLVFTISLTIISITLSEFRPKILVFFKFSRLGYNIFSFFNQRFFIELFYNKYITGLVLKLGGQTTKVLDKGSVELLGPFGLEKGLVNISRNLSSLDTGVVTSYALYILIGLILYILIPYLSLSDNSLLLLILFALFTIKNEIKYTKNSSRISDRERKKYYRFVPISLESSFLFSGKDVLLYKSLFGFAMCFGLFSVNLVVYAMTGEVHLDLNTELENNITELDRLLSQLGGFITQFHNFIIENSINVISDSEGSLAIDVPEDVENSVAQQLSNRIHVFDSLIHDRAHAIEDLLNRTSDLERNASISISDNNYTSQLTQFGVRLRQLIRSYGHINF